MTAPSDAQIALGRLQRMNPRDVWKHEALNFTPWLRDNADRLAQALGIDLEFTEAEHPVGAFSLDLIGRDITHDKQLIVENQLEQSDHSHLGQLLTYAGGTGAATIVWIATHIRDEHRQALDWLNAQTDDKTHFFGVELEVVRIGESMPAPLFNVVVLPNDWQKMVKAASGAAGVSQKAGDYASFWGSFLERLRTQRPNWSKAKEAKGYSDFPMSVGLPTGCSIKASFTAGSTLRHAFYIDRPSRTECKALFDHLHEQRAAIEAAFGGPLSWERLDDNKASIIATYRPGDVLNLDERENYLDWFIDTGDRLRKALGAATVI